ncbi:DUF1800 domain-containing protein [Micromonospora coxensis]|uniref:Uncharacterized conserved protein, DUF1800 family n=1 Tax=Micromonospora coxensis TaxID=356852 RepID=A0A1C5JDF8_9ACTN|nr:DUF1800 family protein [Micromonospora coxensis]SCG68607.1 Uncharacterized conserved protein, DUF1800 family [Micromonospora coxensis]
MSGDVALLLRRAGFGPTSAELGAAAKAGYADTALTLTAPPGPDIGATSASMPRLGPDPYAADPNPTPARRAAADKVREEQAEQLTRWWLDRMTVANHQAVEKLIFFWHGHWATSIRKVKSPQLMLAQHRTLRSARDFGDMARRMVVDPALVYWLDGQLNTRQAPNENLARELCELFLLGIGHYTEADVKAAGRALTGWRLDLRAERMVLDPDAHDPGRKTILGAESDFTARSLVDLLLRQPACAEFIATRLWFRYASSTEPIPPATRARMVAAFPAPMSMLRALFTDDAFRATAGTMVKQPIEWMVGAMRQLELRPANIPRAMLIQLCDGLGGLGQRPFAPPSVGGWPAGATWLVSSSARLKLSLAGKLVSLLEPGRLTPEDVAAMLCVDRWTNRTYAVLREVGNPRMLLTLGLVSPEYAVT